MPTRPLATQDRRSSLQCLFIVQGEGRGHMTQALALRRALEAAGHRVVRVLVGRSARRRIPAFFLEGIGAPVTPLDSPNFKLDAAHRSIHLLPTLLHAARHAPAFRSSLGVLDAHLRRHRPDVVVNFFEPLAGLYYALHRPAVPMVCVGHQYLCLHPDFRLPEGRRVDRWALRRFTRVTALGAARTLALSFYPLPDVPPRRLRVLPPLLREAVFRLPRGVEEDFLLVYLLNRGYADEVVRWHQRHPDVRLHCFWDNHDAAPVRHFDETLTFHQICDRTFLDLMARCGGLACTAGFESVCEAMYLGKPVLMIPVAGHFEQHCNAADAVAAGAGLQAGCFDLDLLLAFLPAYEGPAPIFRSWAESGGPRFVAEIEEAARLGQTPARSAPALQASA